MSFLEHCTNHFVLQQEGGCCNEQHFDNLKTRGLYYERKRESFVKCGNYQQLSLSPNSKYAITECGGMEIVILTSLDNPAYTRSLLLETLWKWIANSQENPI